MSGRPGPSAPGNPGPITKVQEVQLQVEEVSNVMRDNVSQMLSNYEKAEVLEDKAGAFRRSALCSPPWEPDASRSRPCPCCGACQAEPRGPPSCDAPAAPAAQPT